MMLMEGGEHTNGRQKSTKASARGVDDDKHRSCNNQKFTLEPSVEHTRQLPRLDMSFVPTVLYRNTACRNTTHNHDRDSLGDLDPEVVAPLLYPMHDMSYKHMHHDVKFLITTSIEVPDASSIRSPLMKQNFVIHLPYASHVRSLCYGETGSSVPITIIRRSPNDRVSSVDASPQPIMSRTSSSS